VLITGGGVAGLALAAMLARQGREPVVVEKASSYRDSGYGISLYPFGSAVLHGIGAYGGGRESSGPGQCASCGCPARCSAPTLSQAGRCTSSRYPAPLPGQASHAEVTAGLRAALGETAAIPENGPHWMRSASCSPGGCATCAHGSCARARIVLCGDAGTAFLPTAGVGASAALRLAAAVADELSRADARLIPLALDHYL
jgi:2-polyprenyl-6-methoxyphenol hydroxylase-like FAD-dependent oxidoreductase